ncbi:Ataxin-10 domain [Macleaya cordata]|uniref:Ataxin-10 domain n=1 Tax=Macleaya cordata TaxID=56857 RepID=A0A200PPK8_MACCD|nr:Ataxin-10 domain [Macleaya cordata]
MENKPSPAFVVPEHILEPLLILANSSTLDETLQILIESAKTAHGRSNLASKKILPVVLELTKSLISPSTRHLLFSSLKLLRNLCAGEILNQNSFIMEDGVNIISSAFNSLSCDLDLDHEIIRIGLQLLGNVSLAGEEHQAAVWLQFFPVIFSDIARVRQLEICDILCMVLCTCCAGNHERMGQLCGVRGLQIVAEIIRTASTVGLGEDWLKQLLLKICLEESHFSPLFSELGSAGGVEYSDDSKYTENVFTTENAFLLSILSESLNQKIDEIAVSSEFAHSVLGILKRVVGIVDFFSRGKSGLPTGFPTVDVLGYSITILRDICAQQGRRSSKSEGSIHIVNSLLSSGFLDLLLDFLRELEPPTIIKKSISQEETSAQLKVCPYKGFRRDIVAVIGNCLFRMKHVQDEIRQKNAILLLMQQCVTDDDNPFLREWGIWSVRNLLEGNEENQRQVAELELQGSVDVPELSGLGLRVEVDQNTRRAKLVNIPSS